jgi:hypothetical protein
VGLRSAVRMMADGVGVGCNPSLESTRLDGWTAETDNFLPSGPERSLKT